MKLPLADGKIWFSQGAELIWTTPSGTWLRNCRPQADRDKEMDLLFIDNSIQMSLVMSQMSLVISQMHRKMIENGHASPNGWINYTWGLSKIPVTFWKDRTPCASPLRALARVGSFATFNKYPPNSTVIWWYGMSCARPCALLRGPAFLMPLYHALKILSPPKMWLKGRFLLMNPHMLLPSDEETPW